ncbi:MAG: hypothetical protein RLZ98_655 [Pseudomonadota bacterium]|jgi:dipeptidyl aminopeptidase/acylaminoacyl peptidase
MNGRKTETKMKRWQQQRWLLDAVVKTVGIEWDQARISSKARPAGIDALGEYHAVARRIRKFDDCAREFAIQAKRREAIAAGFEAQGRMITARKEYLKAALLWSTACWPIFEESDLLRAYEERVNHCYGKYAANAPYPCKRVEIPFDGKFLPAYLHLPHQPEPGERLPLLICIGGMDSCKEHMVSMYGDPYMERGLAMLALDGPGQAESISRGIYFTPGIFAEAANAVYDWVKTENTLDPEKVVMRGSSFGTYFGTVASAGLGNKIHGFAAAGICQEPGANMIFNMASPTFKMRFMMMSGIDDEDEFDEFCKGIDLRKFAGDIKAPYMILAGERDQLSPIECTIELFELIKAPKRLLIYEGANHGINDAPSATNSEDKGALMADWLMDRLAGKPVVSERVFIDSSGKGTSTPY